MNCQTQKNYPGMVYLFHFHMSVSLYSDSEMACNCAHLPKGLVHFKINLKLCKNASRMMIFSD